MSSVSTFGAFTSARLGIYAAMKGLDVTGHNIANINTRGYTRQVLDQISLKVNGSDRYVSPNDARVGSGVLCSGISQIRDPYLDIRYRNEVSSVGANDARIKVLDSLSAILDEVGKGSGDDAGNGVLEKQFNDLLQQLNKLSGSGVGQSDSEGLVRSSAEALVSMIRSYATRMEGVKGDYDKSFRESIDDVNGLVKQITELNENIRRGEIYGDSCPELRDQRNNALDELSQYMKIDVTYTTEEIGAGVTVQKMQVKLADGKTPATYLIDGEYGAKLSVENFVRNPDAATDPANPYLDAGGFPTGDPKLAALEDSIDYGLMISVPTNRNGKLNSATAVPSEMARDLTGSLNSAREMLTAAGEFRNADNPYTAISRGIPYYQKALDALAIQFATKMNEANSPYLTDGDGYYLNETQNPDGTFTYSRIVGDDGTTELKKGVAMSATEKQKLKDDGKQLGGALFSTSNVNDTTAGITAKNISISKSWSSGSVKIVTTARHPALSTATDNLEHIISIFTEDFDYMPADVDPGAVSTSSFFNGSFQEMFTGISATLAKDTNATAAVLDSYATAADGLNTSRDSISSVDLNDEAANMMQYQKSYAAACRLLTTIDEALDKLINGTGVVGR